MTIPPGPHTEGPEPEDDPMDTSSGSAVPPPVEPEPMTRRQVLEALSGLLLGLFVTLLSSTVVSAALPRIITDLGGGQSAYTWVITSTLLATTASTPIWGKLADLLNRKVLVQVALVMFVASSALAGLSQSPGALIGFRVLQGLGAGGLTALAVVVIADIISPRERGRYMGYMGAVMGIATVSGPLLGGFITDAPGLGWRWCFYVGVPFALISLVLLQKTLHLPPLPRRVVKIDYVGALLITSGVSCLLVWVSLAGQNFAWASWQTAAMVVGGVLLLALAVLVESRVDEPIIPLSLFRNRTVVLAIVASVAVGIAMFGTTVFLVQYMQIGRGQSPTVSGLLTVPMTIGLIGSSTIVGRLITRTGYYKRYMLVGAVLLPLALALMGTIHYDTPYALVGAYMLVLGAGVGMLMQNLVLAVQNVVHPRELGAASSNVAFFRTMGGAVGVSALGALLGNRITSLMPQRLAEAGVPLDALAGNGGQLPDVNALPMALRTVVESTYSDAIAEVFLMAAPIALIALVAVAFLQEIPLSTRTSAQRLADEAEQQEDGATHESVTAERARESASAIVGVDPAAERPGPLA
jgi:EmrB/QacA subfamily drug resistance transporter